MDSAGQGQSLKPKITPKFKLGQYGNVEYDTIGLIADTFQKIIENYNNPSEVVKLAQKGLDIFKEYLEA